MNLSWISKLAILAFIAGAALSCRAQTKPASGDAVDSPRSQTSLPKDSRVVFLHHSTGECIWNGGVDAWFASHNQAQRTNYRIEEQTFPKESPYGWENYPFDYWNIWVRHAGPKPFKQEPTLEMLTAKYNLIVFKHCFPVSNIEEDSGEPNAASSTKSIENYKRQYAALKSKMRSFPKNRFLVWTGAALLQSETEESSARRAKTFFEWVVNEWDEPGDNIYVWDFRQLETEGGFYLKSAYSSGDSHPNEAFSRRAAPMLCQRIVEVIEGRGDTGSRLGKANADEPAPPADRASTHESTEAASAAAATPAGGETSQDGVFVFDDGENPSRIDQWAGAASYATEEKGGRAIRLKFAEADREDWGEYGPHRAIHTRPAAPSVDLAEYRYVALRMKSKPAQRVVLSLVTLPRPEEGLQQSHFRFSAYIDLNVNQWKQVVLDLSRLELGAEGSVAYEGVGSPTRPMQLTLLKFALHEKYARDDLLIDDIVFYRELPAELEADLSGP